MSRRIAGWIFGALLLASPAFALDKGSSLLSLEFGQGTGSFVDPLVFSDPFLGVNQEPREQLEVRAEYWYLFAADYAFNLSAGYGFSSINAEPRTGSASLDIGFSSNSFSVRVGGDRLAKVGDRATFFFGPGVEYWNGKIEYENVTAPSVESESVTRYGFSGRVGGIMHLSETMGIKGQVGHVWGYASAEEDGAKTTWWSGGLQASWGLTFAFGGAE